MSFSSNYENTGSVLQFLIDHTSEKRWHIFNFGPKLWIHLSKYLPTLAPYRSENHNISKYYSPDSCVKMAL